MFADSGQSHEQRDHVQGTHGLDPLSWTGALRTDDRDSYHVQYVSTSNMMVNLMRNILPPKPKVGLVMPPDVIRQLTLAIPVTGQLALRHGDPAGGLDRRWVSAICSAMCASFPSLL